MVKGSDERGAAVDRKHPDRGLPEELVIVPAQTFEGGEQDLHTPAGQPTDKKVFREHEVWLFHMKKYARRSDFIYCICCRLSHIFLYIFIEFTCTGCEKAIRYSKKMIRRRPEQQ